MVYAKLKFCIDHNDGLCNIFILDIKIFIGLLLKFGLVKNKTGVHLMCVKTLIIISVIFVNFH